MGKLYTLDDKLLCGTPEIRIGAKVYPIDDREKTFRKITAINTEGADLDAIDKALELTLGKTAFKEISEQNLPFAAYSALFQLVVAAITGEEPARFQPEEK